MADVSTLRDRWRYRYPAFVRIAHWTNAVCLAILVMSGLQIFNAHPALYWGEDSDFDRPLVSISVVYTTEGRPIGVTSILGRRYDTTGVLGRSTMNGRPVHRAFPHWLTLPSNQDLATGRVWHFFFAWVFVVNGAVYVLHSALTRRLSTELLPRRDEWRHFGRTRGDHVRLRVHRGADYNVLQKLAYLAVALVLAPAIVLTGLAMSPGVTAAAPWLLDVFGGRQSARTIHFVLTGLFVAFAAVHVAMVALSGFRSNMRSMLTGWYSERAR